MSTPSIHRTRIPYPKAFSMTSATNYGRLYINVASDSNTDKRDALISTIINKDYSNSHQQLKYLPQAIKSMCGTIDKLYTFELDNRIVDIDNFGRNITAR